MENYTYLGMKFRDKKGSLGVNIYFFYIIYSLTRIDK